MHSSRSFPFGAALLSILAISSAYTLVSSFDATNFFDEFTFLTGADPTSGFVDYVTEQAAESSEMIHFENGQVYLGVDSTTYNPVGGRQSVRLSSNQAYTQGIFIADIAHMPGGICGTWPAFWMFGPDWPSNGEIDIIEGVNGQATDAITLHTGPGCSVSNNNSLAGTTTISSDCNAGDDASTGCSVSTSNTAAYGSGFNANGGGVFAMQWASTGIYVWFFERSAIAGDIAGGGIPNVQAWGTPMATFESGGSGCDFRTAFANNNIVFDTTFCGSWAGEVWDSGSCAALASSCDAYVAENPAAFTDAYWLINYVKVYQ